MARIGTFSPKLANKAWFKTRLYSEAWFGEDWIVTPTSAGSQFWIKISGTWKPATPWIKVAGVWKVATPYIKVGGVWK